MGKLPVIIDAVKKTEKHYNKIFDTVIDLDITSPLRNVTDIKNAYVIFKSNNSDNLFSVMKSRHNPYFNMVELKTDGYCKLIKNSNVKSRQMAPKVFDMNASFYFYKRNFFSKNYKRVITEKSLCFLMDHICK